MTLPLAFAIITASLLGSLHCAGMCGGLIAFYSSATGSSVLPHLFYNLGRVLVYVSLGVAAGLLGAGIDAAGMLIAGQHFALLLGGLWMVTFGVLTLLRQFMPLLQPLFHNRRLLQFASRRLARFVGQRGHYAALMVGLFTGLMPCGWLYLFVGAAAATARPFDGALLMFLFWLGTTPALLAVGFSLKFATNRVKKLLPLLSSIILITAGGYAIVHRAVPTAPLITSYLQGSISVPYVHKHSCETPASHPEDIP